ncbi:IclR family transcriptional regulator [Natronolimnohabitans innermongolicus]|uniref:IclR family transcriptional regulator n=1 Tax=Natronolimnohabitans innermongolicus JCM 12255 TaxID=1227499 RepID=L9WRH0_9EURY|nr:IclR family transcriptional regulator [Natronolimnohabitans innermongolicus]ELY50918.1 IclR family transcriptional regulator [Natronolimnohabitans innermongolicus JCM 12255]
MGTDNEPRRIQSADRVCDILEHLRETESATVSEVADAVGLSPGTAHTYLSTLESRGFVRKHDDVYRLGLELLPYGDQVRLQNDLYRAATEEIHRLAHDSDACAHLMTEYDGRLLIFQESFGENAIGMDFHPRKRERPQSMLHCTAAGKAILAHMPDYRVAQIIETHGLASYTSSTVTDEAELAAELEQIRERGFALNDQEQMRGLRAVGAPIRYDGEHVVGAVSLSGGASNWSGERFRQELPEKVMRAANAIEVNLHSELSGTERPFV